MIRTCVIVATLFLTVPAFGQINDGSGKWVNPLKSFQDDGPLLSTSVDDSEFDDEQGFSMKPPKWLNPIEFGRSTKAGLQKVAVGTKKFWNGTVSFLNPFDQPAPSKQMSDKQDTIFDPVSNGYKPQLIEPPKPRFRWFWQKDETEDTTTVNGWLNQPNPLLHGRPMTR